MALIPSILQQSSKNEVKKSKMKEFVKLCRKYVSYEFLKSILLDPVNLPIISALILILELILNIVIIEKVRYTEIDWIAYMQECEGFLNGTTNYAMLRGDTGPLVYPAGFLYIYSILYYITSRGQNVRLAQYIFAFIYLIHLYLVLRLYTKSRKVPPYVLVLTTFTSYRIHSIYILRLFNDPIAMLFAYAALNFFLDQKWYLGSIFYSLGVSVKMNILLFAPAILMLYITNLGYVKTIKQLSVCASVQILLGSPFLLTYPIEYIKGSFDLGRIFEHKWTVNYRFLGVEMFENRIFHIVLLVLHLLLLAAFMAPSFKYFQNYCRLRVLESQFQPQIDRKNKTLMHPANEKKTKNQNTAKITKEQKKFLDQFKKSLQKISGNKQNVSPSTENSTDIDNQQEYSIHFDKAVQLALLPIFLCNFIGVICARSLHYQFYVWYFHSLPYLCWSTNYRLGLRFLLLGLIEWSWNTYPSTNESSVTLHICHLTLLIGIAEKIFMSTKIADKLK